MGLLWVAGRIAVVARLRNQPPSHRCSLQEGPEQI